MDIMTLEEITVLEHLESDPRNFVIRQGNFYHFVNVKDALNNLEENTVFPCISVGDSNYSNVDTSIELYNARKLGTISGYFSMDKFIQALRNVVEKNVRLYDLSDPLSISKVPAVVSKLYYQGRSGMVSSLHCQEGSEGDIYDLVPIKVSGTPKFDSFNDEFFETDVNLVVMAYTVVNNATVKPKPLESMRKDIVLVGKRIISENRGRQFTRNVRHSNIYIKNTDEIVLLKLWGSLFHPKIKKVVINENVYVDDFSFLRYMGSLKCFECLEEYTNVSSIIHELRAHVNSLYSLKIFSTRTLNESMSDFTSLQRITVNNPGVNTSAFESVLKRISEIPNLEYINVNGYKSPSPKLFHILGTCVSKPKHVIVSSLEFTGDLSPISRLDSIQELYIDLPKFKGSFNGLRSLKKMTKLTSITGKRLDLNTGGMNLKKVIQKKVVPYNPIGRSRPRPGTDPLFSRNQRAYDQRTAQVQEILNNRVPVSEVPVSEERRFTFYQN